MRRAERLFDIIQSLISGTQPLTASMLADRLEVSLRTIYRDIAVLQARRVPIDGEPGVGYVLRRGYDLPPLSFTIAEIDAIAVGVRMIRRLRDKELRTAADCVLSKLVVSVPETMRQPLAAPQIWVSDGAAPVPAALDPADARGAIRKSRKLRIGYVDERGRRTRRTIYPIAMVYYVDVTLIAAWCELRANFRHFRIERIMSCTVLEEQFSSAKELMEQWLASRENGAATH